MTGQFAATTPEELLPMAGILGMSGLEFMTGILEGRIAGAPIAATLNFRLDTVAAGRVVFRGTPLFSAANPLGTVHGGWYGTILDSCMACAVMTGLRQGQVYTTLEYKLNIIRPIPVGTEVIAVGEASHVGRSTGVAEGRILGATDGRLYATGSTTCIVMTP